MVMGICVSTTSFFFRPTTEISGPLRTSKGMVRTPSTLLDDRATIFSECLPSGILVVSSTNLTGGSNSANGLGSSSRYTFMILLSSMSFKIFVPYDILDMVRIVFLGPYQIFNAEKQGYHHQNNGRPDNYKIPVTRRALAVRNVLQAFGLVL